MIFRRYFEQKEITASHADVPVSYYRNGRKLLCVITDLGNEPFDGTVTFDLHALGLPAGKLAATVLDGAKVEVEDTQVQRTPVPLDGSILKLQIPRHDFRLVEVER